MSLFIETHTDSWPGEPPEPFAAPGFYRGVLSRRVFAYCVDVVLIALLLIPVWLICATLTVLTFGLLSPVWLIFGLVPVAYHSLLIGGRYSATLGMRMFEIEVRSWTGARPSLLQAFIQTVLFYVTTAATCWLILLIAPFERRKRTVHDILAGTLVIRRFPKPDILTAS
ncbi:MAG TPA: RDD family protein [Stellaceae bacterium]|nr:RDD family protein [Stellaceae bacterium]